MKKRSARTLSLNKKSVSNLNQSLITGGAVGASSHPSVRTACLSCTRSCLPCPITLADEDGCKKESA